MGRPADAEALLAAEAGVIRDERAGHELAAVQALIDAWLGRAPTAMRAAERILGTPGVSDRTVVLACWALHTAGGVLGRLAGLDAARMRTDALPDSFTYTGMLSGIMHTRSVALRLAGRLDEANRAVEDYCETLPDRPRCWAG